MEVVSELVGAGVELGVAEGLPVEAGGNVLRMGLGDAFDACRERSTKGFERIGLGVPGKGGAKKGVTFGITDEA